MKLQRHIRTIFLAAFALAGGLVSPLAAAEFDVHGFLEPQLRAAIGDKNKLGIIDSYEPFFRAELDTLIDDRLSARMAIDGNVFYTNSLMDAIALDLKEMYGEIYLDRVTVRFGRQIFTWGSVEDMSPTDVLNPQELVDLAQNSGERKLGVFALSMQADLDKALLEAVVIPLFRSSVVDINSPFSAAVDPSPQLEQELETWGVPGKQAAARSRKSLEDGLTQVQDGYGEVTAGIAQIDDGIVQIDGGIAELDTAIAFMQANNLPSVVDPNTGQTITYDQAIATKLDLVNQKLDLYGQREDLYRTKRELEETQAELEGYLATLEAETKAAEEKLRASLADYQDDRPKPLFESIQAAARVKFPTNVGDFAFSYAYMIQNIPSVEYSVPNTYTELPTSRLVYPRVHMLGFDSVILFNIFNFKLDTGFFLTEDLKGTDPWISNPYMHTVAQFGAQPTQWIELRLAYLGQFLFNIDNKQEKAQELTNSRLSGNPMFGLVEHGAMVYTGFKFGKAIHRLNIAYLLDIPNVGHFISPEFDFGFKGGLRLTVGAQLMAGDRANPGFGRLAREDQAYTRLKYSF